jgi:hypothetical protein
VAEVDGERFEFSGEKPDEVDPRHDAQDSMAHARGFPPKVFVRRG